MPAAELAEFSRCQMFALRMSPLNCRHDRRIEGALSLKLRELALTIATANWTNRVNDGLQVPLR